nr:hypothetical protein BdHM001_15110 [Bdellovibrio sp. HM001]
MPLIKKLTSRTVFLFDGLGALLSLILTGIFLPFFSEQIGLPRHVLYILASFPLVYSIFSLGCYYLAKETARWMLKTIISANSGYCLLSGIILLTYADITIWGQAILLAEILVILAVVGIELKVLARAGATEI